MSLDSVDHKESLHTWSKRNMRSLSSKYNSNLGRLNKDIIIPSPAIFTFGQPSKPSATTTKYISTKGTECHLPTVAECATHLELLEVFYRIRQQLLASKAVDEAMGITPNREIKTGKKGDTKAFKDPTLWERRQEKWTVYLEFAVVRFQYWMRALELRTEYFISEDEGGKSSLLHLPPLDVLMVWHSFMLNPRLYREVCKDHPIYKVRMPWHLVHKAINSETWTFNLDETAAQYYESGIEVPADLFAHFVRWGVEMKSADNGHMLRPNRFKLSGVEHTDTEPEGVSELYARMFTLVDANLGEQLRDAVIRQSEFVDKMNNHLWIRSPALEGTMRRAIQRYDRFLVLLKHSKSKQPVVPTLDVDIAWHTHQCAAAEYFSGTKTMVGRFINHDDTIVKEVLGDGFELTRNMYRVRFGKEYKICGCWDCEELLSAVEEAKKKGEGEVDMDAIAKKAEDRVVYYRARELALRKSNPDRLE